MVALEKERFSVFTEFLERLDREQGVRELAAALPPRLQDILERHLFSTGENQETLDQVLQLANIALPLQAL